MSSDKSRSDEGTEKQDKPLLAVTTGDPCGVGPEIALKAVASEPATSAARLLVLGDERNLRRTARDLKLRWPFTSVIKEPPDGRRWEKPQLLDLALFDEPLIPGQITASAGKAAARAIETAVEFALAGKVDGIVTAPLHKEALALAGYSDPGHTEMLARLADTKKVGMLFWSEKLSVALLTTHMSLRDAIKKVRRGNVYDKLVLFDREWTQLMDQRPRMAVAALNPHASEHGRFGTEESQCIVPAIEKARSRGLLVEGPISADTVFAKANDGAYDLVLSLYHDQGTIPVKLLYGRQSVNVTVGLPFVRTSVDHGTAMDIAGKGQASEESLVCAILAAARFVNTMRARDAKSTKGTE
ncbi:MAG: 4-hydroxythreonine-4-phosphate dehydrogenase PdxA [Acidobacteriota bacterium]|nr:MAG: 4-hydroxythreonine-4-phosphate dehydrogenase PdxA [Acidobacteriota bacterium]